MNCYSFNLVREPWIPCLMPDGKAHSFGILEVLLRAHEIREIYHPSPLVTVALHRLLIAILHRNFGPKNPDEWARLWQSGQGPWQPKPLKDYFREWDEQKNRFNLFDDKRPFYQTGSLEFSYTDPKTKKEKAYEKSIAALQPQLSSGNNPTLFDHATDESPHSLTSAQAACYLVAHQTFTVCGTITSEASQDRKKFGSADASPLLKSALVLLRGDSLFQTLLLNMCAVDGSSGLPFKFDPSADRPAWERDGETQPADRIPDGYLDLLTWQSRRIRLHPESAQALGKPVVRKAVIMKGYQFVDDYHLYGRETMVAFNHNPKPAAGQSPWPAVAFRQGRSVWRDSLSLLQTVDAQRARPAMLDWINDLTTDGILERDRTFPLDLCGVATDRATIHLWRHERFPVPGRYLNEPDLVDSLNEALQLVEQLARLFKKTALEIDGLKNKAKSPFLRLAETLLSPGDAKDPDPNEVANLIESFQAETAFWSRLETPFLRLMAQIARAPEDDPDRQDFLELCLRDWAQEVGNLARNVFYEIVSGLDTSARALKAQVESSRTFHFLLNRILQPYKEELTNEPADIR